MSNSFFAFMLACLVIELTPGPNMAYLVILSIQAGRRAGLITVAGIASGLSVVGVLAAFGAAELLSESPFLYGFLHWAGTGYLLWLAYCGWYEETEIAAEVAQGKNYHSRYFLRGFITNLLNPKAALFYIAVVPGFIDINAPFLPQMAMLALVSVSIATAMHTGIVLLAGQLRRLIDSPARLRATRRGLALLLAFVALWFGFAIR